MSPASPPGPASDPLSDSPLQPKGVEPHPHHVPRWLERVELFLRVMLRMYIGLAISFAPWWYAAWDANPLFRWFPALGAFALLGPVRGLVTGLGLLNLWIAFQDAIRPRDGEV